MENSNGSAETAAPRNPYEFTREAYDQLVEGTARPQVSKRSKYEEVELVEDCTLFDIYRQPRPPVTDPSATKTLSVRMLNADLTCPICLGIIKETTVVMECLHRFCRDCITEAIQRGNRECPSCRIHIPSRRSLRSDANFDELIRKIHPNLAEFERNEDKLIEQLNRSRHFNNSHTKSTKMGVMQQAATRRKVTGRKKATESSTSTSTSTSGSTSRVSSPSTASGPSPPSTSASPAVGEKRSVSDASPPSDGASVSPPSSGAASAEEENSHKKLRTAGSSQASEPATPSGSRVNLRVLLHDKEKASAPTLARSLFTTSPKLKVRHLKKHLCNLLKLDSYANMCVVLPAVNCSLSGLSASPSATVTSSGEPIRKDLLCDQELEDYVTIHDIYEQYGPDTAWELRLLYHFSPDEIVNGIAQFLPSGK